MKIKKKVQLPDNKVAELREGRNGRLEARLICLKPCCEEQNGLLEATDVKSETDFQEQVDFWRDW
jgi:hypothetical protein